jgi:hypothetical protein
LYADSCYVCAIVFGYLPMWCCVCEEGVVELVLETKHLPQVGAVISTCGIACSLLLPGLHAELVLETKHLPQVGTL